MLEQSCTEAAPFGSGLQRRLVALRTGFTATELLNGPSASDTRCGRKFGDSKGEFTLFLAGMIFVILTGQRGRFDLRLQMQSDEARAAATEDLDWEQASGAAVLSPQGVRRDSCY